MTTDKKPGKIKIASVMLIIILALVLVLSFVFKESKEPTETEIRALNEVFGTTYTIDDYTVITEDLMSQERQKKFKAVKKIFKTPTGDYGFISKPVAYNGPISLALGIDGKTGITIGLRIVEHIETEHYVRDMTNTWFTDRFAGKVAEKYLKAVKLDTRSDDEVILITGATVTTDGIVNGVNACLGVYQEAFLNKDAEEVPYMVRFEREDGDGPEETGTVAIRAYGVVLGEVSIEEIRKMPSVKRTLSIKSTSGTSNHSFRGTLLSNVFDAVDPKLVSDYKVLQPVGVDDYLSNISMDEVMAENKVFLMYEDNGEPLSTKSGEPGAMWVVVLDDFFGQRFTNYLIEIVLE